MSAWIVSLTHIDELVRARYWFDEYNKPTDDDLSELGRTLWAENIRSVEYRYEDCAGDDLPGASSAVFEAKGYNAPSRGPRPDPVVILKALSCLEYQSCETENYEETPAYKELVRLRALAIAALPGYDDAPWGIDSD